MISSCGFCLKKPVCVLHWLYSTGPPAMSPKARHAQTTSRTLSSMNWPSFCNADVGGSTAGADGGIGTGLLWDAGGTETTFKITGELGVGAGAGISSGMRQVG